MFKIFVDSEEKERRRSLCISCEYYKADTRTCGTFRGINPLGDKVVYNGQEFTLCGCVMPVKWNFSSSSCSVGKWGRKISDEFLADAKKIVELYRTRPSIVDEEMRQIVDIYNKATSKNQRYTTCGSCIKDMINELNKLVENA